MGKCLAKVYTDNIVITHGPIVCWGWMTNDKQNGQPPCDYLEQCFEEHRPQSTRVYNNRKKLIAQRRQQWQHN